MPSRPSHRLASDSSDRSPQPANMVVFGGTFDPIHNGHLRTAWDLHETLGYEQITLMPCGVAYHKGDAQTSMKDRSEMLKAATQGISSLRLDLREIERAGPTFTVDTLTELRQSLGNAAHLVWVVGQDAAQTLHKWHKWQQIFDLANVIVVARPGAEWPDFSRWPAKIMSDLQTFKQSAFGAVYKARLTPLPISSSQIRQILSKGGSVRFLAPDQVVNLIDQQQLYRGNHKT